MSSSSPGGPTHHFLPDCDFLIEAERRIVQEGMDCILDVRLAGACAATQRKPISNGQESLVLRFLKSHHLTINLDESPTLARLIVDLMEGIWCKKWEGQKSTGFTLQRVEATPDHTSIREYPIPRSTFLLRYLSGLLRIAIIVLDVAAKPLYIQHPTPRALVALLHDSSNILGYSHYYVLQATRTPTEDITVSSNLPQPQPTLPPPGLKAEYRSNDRARESRKTGCEMDEAVVMEYFTKQCADRVKADTVEKCQKAKNRAKNDDDPEEALRRARNSAWRDDIRRSKIPRGLLTATAQLVRTKYHLDGEQFTQDDCGYFINRRSHGTTLKMYKSALQIHFLQAWNDAIALPSGTRSSATNNSTTTNSTNTDSTLAVSSSADDIKDAKAIRTVSLPLRQLIRHDLSVRDQERISQRLTDVQGQISNFMEAVAMGAYKTTIWIAQGHLQGISSKLNLADLFPPTFAMRDDYFVQHPVVEAGVITREWQQQVKDCLESKPRVKDPATFLSQDYLQYLGARLPGSSKSIPNTPFGHPEWDRALQDIYHHQSRSMSESGDVASSSSTLASPTGGNLGPSSGVERSGGGLMEMNISPATATLPGSNLEELSKTGLSGLSNTLMREYATNIDMVWQRGIYERLRKYVVHNVLRLNLRPLAEAKHRSNKQQRAQRKEEERRVKEEAVLQNRSFTPSGWRRVNRDLFDQLDHAVDTGREQERTDKLLTLIDLHQNRRPIDNTIQQSGMHGTTIGDDFEMDSDSEFGDSDDEGSDDDEVGDENVNKQDVDMDIVMEASVKTHTDEPSSNMDSSAVNVEHTGGTSGSGVDLTRSSSTETLGVKEPSAKKVQSLEAVANKLLDLDTDDAVTEEMVRDHLFEDHKYESFEIEPVVRLVKLLKPFAPRKVASGNRPAAYPKSALILAPFVYIANAILRVCGYKDFTRRICPVYAVGHRHAVPLDASAMYEVFSGQVADRFDFRAPSQRIITSSMVAQMSIPHRDSMFSGLFDLSAVDYVCKKHGLSFAHRITYVDPYTVRITGQQAKTGPHRHPSVSAYEDKKKNHIRPPGGIHWGQELIATGHTRATAKLASDEVKVRQEALKAELAPLKKDLKSAVASRRSADRAHRHSRGQSRSIRKQLYRQLQDARTTVRNLKRIVVPLEADLRMQNKYRYYFNNLSKATAPTPMADPPTPIKISTPTINQPGIQDFVETTSIDRLLESVVDKEYQLPLPGTDRGLVVMSETVPSRWSTLDSMKNRFLALQNHPDTQTQQPVNDVDTIQPPTSGTNNMSVEVSQVELQSLPSSTPTSPLLDPCTITTTSPSTGAPSPTQDVNSTISSVRDQKADLDAIRFPKSHRITSRQIYETGGGRKAARAREAILRKPENSIIPRLHKEIAENSVLNARTIGEVDAAQTIRQAAATPLRKFESTKKLVKESHRRDLLTERAWKTVAAQERQHIRQFARDPHQPLQQSAVAQSAHKQVGVDILKVEDSSTGTGTSSSPGSSAGVSFGSFPPELPPSSTYYPTERSVPATSSSELSSGPASTTTPSDAPVRSVHKVDPTDGYCTCGEHHLPIRTGGVLKYPTVCPKDILPVLPLMFVGTAGIGNGSRLGGHLKYGGKRVIEQHRHTTPVLMTDENNTSKVCPLCFSLVSLVKELRKVNGVDKLVSVHGAIQCDNPDCMSVQLGYARRGRDSNACINIALAGFTQLTSSDRLTLPPFRKVSRPPGATQQQHQSTVTGTSSSPSTSITSSLSSDAVGVSV